MIFDSHEAESKDNIEEQTRERPADSDDPDNITLQEFRPVYEQPINCAFKPVNPCRPLR